MFVKVGIPVRRKQDVSGIWWMVCEKKNDIFLCCANCLRTKNNLETSTKKSIALEWKGEGLLTLFAAPHFHARAFNYRLHGVHPVNSHLISRRFFYREKLAAALTFWNRFNRLLFRDFHKNNKYWHMCLFSKNINKQIYHATVFFVRRLIVTERREHMIEAKKLETAAHPSTRKLCVGLFSHTFVRIAGKK